MVGVSDDIVGDDGRVTGEGLQAGRVIDKCTVLMDILRMIALGVRRAHNLLLNCVAKLNM